jgi:hypothetical protein
MKAGFKPKRRILPKKKARPVARQCFSHFWSSLRYANSLEKKKTNPNPSLMMTGFGFVGFCFSLKKLQAFVQPAFWPAALMRRKFSADKDGGEFAQGEFTSSEH